MHKPKNITATIATIVDHEWEMATGKRIAIEDGPTESSFTLVCESGNKYLVKIEALDE